MTTATASGVELVLARLEAVKPKGTGSWRALCPCHNDKSPSLDIDVKGDRWVAICRSCGVNGTAVLEALGMTWADLNGAVDGVHPPYLRLDDGVL